MTEAYHLQPEKNPTGFSIKRKKPDPVKLSIAEGISSGRVGSTELSGIGHIIVSLLSNETHEFDLVGEIIFPRYDESVEIINIRESRILPKVVSTYRELPKKHKAKNLYKFSGKRGTPFFILEKNGNPNNFSVNRSIFISTGSFYPSKPSDAQDFLPMRQYDLPYETVVTDFSEVLEMTVKELYSSVDKTPPDIELVLHAPRPF